MKGFFFLIFSHLFSPQSVVLYKSIKVVLVVLGITTLLTKQNLYLSLTETAGNLVMFNGWVVDPRYEDVLYIVPYMDSKSDARAESLKRICKITHTQVKQNCLNLKQVHLFGPSAFCLILKQYYSELSFL